MLAYILIKAPPKRSGDVVSLIGKLKPRGYRILEAVAVLGDYDVICKAEVDSDEGLYHLVMEDIQGLGAVEGTRTFIAIRYGDLYYDGQSQA